MRALVRNELILNQLRPITSICLYQDQDQDIDKMFQLFAHLIFRFGANYRSTDTGIIYNNQMMDFNSRIKINAPNSPLAAANFIHAGKRPLASMSPIIMTSYNENVRFVIGGAGGRKIIPATTLVRVR